MNKVNATHQRWDAGVDAVSGIVSISDAVGIKTTKEALVAFITTGLGVFESDNSTVKALVNELGDGIGAVADPKGLGPYIATKAAQISVNTAAAWSINVINDEYVDVLDADTALQKFFQTCGSQDSINKIMATKQPQARGNRWNNITRTGVAAVNNFTSVITAGCQKVCQKVCAANSTANASCSVANGTGSVTNTCAPDGTRWINGTCKATNCSAGFTLRPEGCVKTFCQANSTAQQSCAIANGSGSTTNTCSSDGARWVNGACQATNCNAGFKRSGNACVKL